MNNCTFCDAAYEGPGHQHKPQERAHAFGDKVLETRNGRWYSANGSPMPPWWSPEQRFAWRHKQGRAEDHANGWRFDKQSDAGNLERITASLETGEEVPA